VGYIFAGLYTISVDSYITPADLVFHLADLGSQLAGLSKINGGKFKIASKRKDNGEEMMLYIVMICRSVIFQHVDTIS
jgi:hypothetical protein